MLSRFGETDVSTEVFQTKTGQPYTNTIPTCSCYGLPLSNQEEMMTFLFEDATVIGGRIVAYYENFPTGTTFPEAIRKVLEYLPSAKAGNLVIDRSGGECGLVTMTSHALARELETTAIKDPKGLIGVEFSFTNAQSNIEFVPKNVESALVMMEPPSGDSCYGPSSGITLLPPLRSTKSGSGS